MRPQSATTPTHADAPSNSTPHGGPGAPHQQPGFGPGTPHTGAPGLGMPHTGGPSTHGAHSPSTHGPGGRPDAPGTRPDGPGSRPDASRPRTDAPGGHPNSPSRPDTQAPHNRPDGNRPDGTRPDAARPDGARPRGDSPTAHPGQRPDAPGQPHNRPDGSRPDGHRPDHTRPDSRPDGSRPDSSRPDTTRPGSAHPDTRSHAPDRPGHTPDRPGNAPDSNRPDGHAPDSPRHDPDAPGHHDKPDGDTPNDPHSHADEPRPDPAEAHARHAETTPAGVSHHGGDPDMGDLPHRVPNDPRFFTADVHITPDGRARIGGHDYTPAEYADMLRRSGYDGSKPVRLIGCDAGSNDFAKQLSKHLDAPVVAPTKPAWTDANGRVFTSDVEIGPDGTRQPKIPPNGEWETHHPDGTKTKASDDGYAPGSDRDTDGADAKDRGDDQSDQNDQNESGDQTDRPQDEHVPPTAVERLDEPLDLDEVRTHDPGATPRTTDTGPADARRGAVLDEFPKDDPRVTGRNKDGLITEIEGKPVKEYIEDLSKRRSEAIAPNVHKKDGACSAVAIDLKTGLVTEGFNGRAKDVLQVDELHPLLRDNYKQMADWRHGVESGPGEYIPNKFDGGKPTMFDGKAHHDLPLRHAEVKAANELLWARQRSQPDVPLTPETLDELRFDPRWVKDGLGDNADGMKIGAQAPACANCDNILRGVPSYAGRYSYHPQDHRSSVHSVAPW